MHCQRPTRGEKGHYLHIIVLQTCMQFDDSTYSCVMCSQRHLVIHQDLKSIHIHVRRLVIKKSELCLVHTPTHTSHVLLMYGSASGNAADPLCASHVTAASVVAGGESEGDGGEAHQPCSGSSQHHLQADTPPGSPPGSPPAHGVSTLLQLTCCACSACCA